MEIDDEKLTWRKGNSKDIHIYIHVFFDVELSDHII